MTTLCYQINSKKLQKLNVGLTVTINWYSSLIAKLQLQETIAKGSSWRCVVITERRKASFYLETVIHIFKEFQRSATSEFLVTKRWTFTHDNNDNILKVVTARRT